MSKSRILVVEDEFLIASDIQHTLHAAGYENVDVVNTSAAALQQAESGHPDLVLMDIALQGEHSGIAAASKMRECWSIPVIFVTGNVDEETLARARSVGPYGFLTKPFRAEELVESVGIALEHHRRVEKLFASTQWLTKVLDSLTDSIIATDEKGTVRYLNPAAERLTGWSPSEAGGKAIEKVYPLTQLSGEPVRECLLRRALATGRFFGRSRLWLSTRSGGQTLIEDSATPIVQDGIISGAVTIFSDVTLQREQERRQESERDRLEEEAQAAGEALGQTRQELRALAAGLMASQEQERRRIARELHDDIGQQVAALVMLVDRADTDASEKVRSRLQQIAADLRKTSHMLHPSILEDLGITAALDTLVEQEQQNGRDVHFSCSLAESQAVPLNVATTFYRIAQEALRNAMKHAPQSGVQISLWQEAAKLIMQIQDDGPGFSISEAKTRGGLGLISMQERATAIGGSLSLSSRPGEGTVVLVEAPLP